MANVDLPPSAPDPGEDSTGTFVPQNGITDSGVDPTTVYKEQSPAEKIKGATAHANGSKATASGDQSFVINISPTESIRVDVSHAHLNSNGSSNGKSATAARLTTHQNGNGHSSNGNGAHNLSETDLFPNGSASQDSNSMDQTADHTRNDRNGHSRNGESRLGNNTSGDDSLDFYVDDPPANGSRNGHEQGPEYAKTGAMPVSPAEIAKTQGMPAANYSGADPQLVLSIENTIQMLQETGAYDSVEYFAKGGMGLVFSARHIGLDREVIIKTLDQSIFERKYTDPAQRDIAIEQATARFEKEYRVIGQLGQGHPNIVIGYDSGSLKDGTKYYAQQKINGPELKDAIDALWGVNRDIPSLDITSQTDQLVLGPFLGACEGLVFTHELGIIHRDLKPSNIMLTHGSAKEALDRASDVLDFPTAKVLDFGLALSPGEQEVGLIVGTPVYMSPEQATGREITSHSDTYAMGTILYEILTGSQPYATQFENGIEGFKSLTDPSDDNYPNVLEANPTANKYLAAIAHKAMTKDPAERYENVGEMIADLQKYNQDHVVSAYQEKLPTILHKLAYRGLKATQRTLQWALKNKGAVGILTLVVAAGAGFVAKRYSDTANNQRIEENLSDELGIAQKAFDEGSAHLESNDFAKAREKNDKAINICESNVGATTSSEINESYQELLERTLERRDEIEERDVQQVINEVQTFTNEALAIQSKTLDLSYSLLHRTEANEASAIEALDKLIADGASDEDITEARLKLQTAESSFQGAQQKLTQALLEQDDDIASAKESLNKAIALLGRQARDSKHREILNELRQSTENHLATLNNYEDLVHQVELLESWTHTGDRLDDVNADLIQELSKAQQLYSSLEDSNKLTPHQLQLLRGLGEKLDVAELLAHIPSPSFPGSQQQLKEQFKTFSR